MDKFTQRFKDIDRKSLFATIIGLLALTFLITTVKSCLEDRAKDRENRVKQEALAQELMQATAAAQRSTEALAYSNSQGRDTVVPQYNLADLQKVRWVWKTAEYSFHAEFLRKTDTNMTIVTYDDRGRKIAENKLTTQCPDYLKKYYSQYKWVGRWEENKDLSPSGNHGFVGFNEEWIGGRLVFRGFQSDGLYSDVPTHYTEIVQVAYDDQGGKTNYISVFWKNLPWFVKWPLMIIIGLMLLSRTISWIIKTIGKEKNRMQEAYQIIRKKKKVEPPK